MQLKCLRLLPSATCAGLVGLMTVAGLTDHRGKSFFPIQGRLGVRSTHRSRHRRHGLSLGRVDGRWIT